MSKQEAVREARTFELPEKKIQVRPIKRKGQWLPEGHSGHFLYDNAYIGVEIPQDATTGRRVNVLTREERDFFEDPSRSGLDFTAGELSEHRRDNNFWDNFNVQLSKTIKELDLRDPMQYLQYALLRANTGPHGLVAPNWESRFNYPTYRYALVEEDYDAVQGARKAEDKSRAYKFFIGIEDSFDKMYDFLMVYWLENPRANKPLRSSKKDLLVSEISSIIENDLQSFLKVVDDANGYDRKLFLHNALQNGHIEYNGRDTYRLMPESVVVGSTAKEAIDYLYSPKNQEILLRIRALMEQAGN